MTAVAPRRRSLTVVVAAWNDPELLRTCLRSLEVCQGRESIEVIVASPAGRGFEATVSEFAATSNVSLASDATVPALRAAGLARATGDIVAFLEDHAMVAPSWADALLEAFAEPAVRAAGGPVAQAPGLSTLDWGAYLFDYGRFMPPAAAGPVRELSGLNMAFARELLDTLGDSLRDGVIEGPLLDVLRRRGVALHLVPAALVYQTKRYSLRETLVSVYYLGRGYAGRRVQGTASAGRLVRAAGSLVLPAVLVWRVLSVVLPKGRDTGRVLAAVGYLCLIALAWSVGEGMGYVAGAGDSETRWRRGTA
jgi:glycosyltransferase involved in cell wall biosynthesis